MSQWLQPQRGFDAQLQQAKLDALKELAYGASHEINNPLANISARAQTLLRDERDPERRRALEAVHQQAMRAHEMISDLMLFARPPTLQLQVVQFEPLLRRLAGEYADECQRRDIQLVLEVAGEVPAIRGDGIQLAVAISALVRNAVEAVGQTGKIVLQAASKRPGPLGFDQVALQLAVADSGPGIPPHVREHMFDPFFSGREAGRGLGFGMSKAWRIVTLHGGRLALDESHTPGARFVIDLPLGEGQG